MLATGTRSKQREMTTVSRCMAAVTMMARRGDRSRNECRRCYPPNQPA